MYDCIVLVMVGEMRSSVERLIGDLACFDGSR